MLINRNPYENVAMPDVPVYYTKRQLDAAVAAERERCAKLCEAAQPAGGRQWDEAQSACFDALGHVATVIRGA